MGKAYTQSGFTMLPLILFMFVIIGLVSAGVMMLGPKAQLGKTVETTKSLDSIANTVILWSASSRTLPPTLQTVFTGANPLDPWGNNILYLYDNNLTTTATGGICGRTTTNLNVNGTPNTAFALLSTSGDALQSTWSGLPVLSTAVLTYPTTVLGTTATLVTGDLFKIVSLEELKNRAGCYGSTQGRLKILNNELPSACSGSAYSATLYAEGGVPSYTWTTATPGWSINPSSGILSNPAPLAGLVTVKLTDAQGTPNQHVYTLKVVTCGAPAPSPTAAWNFNEGSGNTIGSGATSGTIVGTPSWVPHGSGTALSLNGINNYIYFNDINYFNIGTGNVTLSAWVNFSGKPTQTWCDPVTKVNMAIGAIAGKGFLYPAIGYGMYVTQTQQCTSCTSGCGTWSNYKVAFQLRNPSNTDIHNVYSDDIISGGNWAHIVAVLDRSAIPATDQIKLYINGIKQTDSSNDYQYTSQTSLNFDNNFKFTIGARHDGGSGYGFPYWGLIDDVQFYKSALTDSQINSLYVTGQTP
ncbi:MAG: LamG domain-containing protein [Desulfuromonadaceae bacterium]|nr:LamG domain-containing protein [Desulfuromonadaceae bacterium]MDD2848796.1 LamG domain-containing protein [Desulfuromonadaceae bacterium]MDD4130446.1 LamG domain-containing protein [Desulfuromonadaceae bacterium]